MVDNWGPKRHPVLDKYIALFYEKIENILDNK
jgi:hypothetical protein